MSTIYFAPMVFESPSQYDATSYPPFAVTADVSLFTIRRSALEVLLIERRGEPYLGAWALPGGFVHPKEDLEEAASRELAEETGLEGGAWHLEQLAAYGAPDRDPRMRVVTVAFWAVCADVPTPRGGGDAAKADLVPVARIESGAVRLAFDHELIVRDAVERIRSRMEHTAVAAGFCPPEFTIRQLRQVYEAVWGASLDPGNFQRYVRKCGAFEQRVAPPLQDGFKGRPKRGRPASLWAARRTADGFPATTTRTLARPGDSTRTDASISAGNR